MDRSHGHRPYGPPEPADQRAGGRIRILAGITLVVFAVTLAVLVSQRLSDQAMAVLAGAVCGVGASIPTSLLIVWVTRRRQEERQEQRSARHTNNPYPPVIVVQQPGQPRVSEYQQSGYLPSHAPSAQREFNIVGGEIEEVGYERYQ